MNEPSINEPNPTASEWASALAALAAGAVVVEAEKLVEKGWLGGTSRPFVVRASDGQTYLVKRSRWRDSYRHLFTEHIAARLGATIGAPVPAATIVRISAEFIARHAEQLPPLEEQAREPGLYHGVQWIEPDWDAASPKDRDFYDANRERNARLAIFCGWTHAADHLRKGLVSKGKVFAIDFDRYFTRAGEVWSPESLEKLERPGIDRDVFERGRLRIPDLSSGISALAAVTVDDVARAIRAAPDEWGVLLEHQVAFARVVWKRRRNVLWLAEHGFLNRVMYRSPWRDEP